MALEDRIDAVKKISKAFEKSVDDSPQIPSGERIAPNKEQFDTAVNQAQKSEDNKKTVDQEQKKITETTTASAPSLMEEVKKLNTKVTNVTSLSPEDLKNQARDLIAQMENVKSQLTTSQSQIRPSYNQVLQNRLTHIDDNLRIALSKAGVEYVAPSVDTGIKNPMHRFLGFLTQGQYQLQHLHDHIGKLVDDNTRMNPANLLLIQMKVGYIQNEIELFTSCLNKALESTKTIMNVQV